MRTIAVVVVATASLLSACGTSNLNFVADTRVKFLAPDARETVTLPVTVSWEASDLPPGTRFGVFVDRSPMKPGQSVNALVDDQCKRTPDCPTREYLETRGLYITSGTSLTFETLPNTNAGKRNQLKETQRITIVYLDENNRRMSESAFEREFFLDRKSS